MTPASPQPTQAASALSIIARTDGSAGHDWLSNADAFGGRHAPRNLADVVHHLCLLHGRHPGVIDHACNHTAEEGARDWLIKASNGFATERTLITRLVVAVGPTPSTPGQSESESAVLAQHHALDMLAQSDRRGCALGAAAALAIDWWALRSVVEKAANRFGVDAQACALPSADETMAMIATVSSSPSIERAITFGAQQLISQHRGLWDLLEARQIARGEW